MRTGKHFRARYKIVWSAGHSLEIVRAEMRGWQGKDGKMSLGMKDVTYSAFSLYFSYYSLSFFFLWPFTDLGHKTKQPAVSYFKWELGDKRRADWHLARDLNDSETAESWTQVQLNANAVQQVSKWWADVLLLFYWSSDQSLSSSESHFVKIWFYQCVSL